MPKIVQFQDLPGGPVPVEFSDELSHRNVCTKCEMISMSMYVDEQEHIFCNACIQAASKESRIFCKLENANVLLKNFTEAHQGIIILRSMRLYCPNAAKGCKEMSTIATLPEHYMKCIYTTITCTACKSQIKAVDYNAHLSECTPPNVQCPHCFRGMPKRELKTHTCSTRASDITNTGYKKETPLPNGATSLTTYEADNHASSQSTVAKIPYSQDSVGNSVVACQSQEKQNPEGVKKSCDLCDKTVKFSLWNKHRGHCEKVPTKCDICHREFPRISIESHKTECRMLDKPSPTPDSLPQSQAISLQESIIRSLTDTTAPKRQTATEKPGPKTKSHTTECRMPDKPSPTPDSLPQSQAISFQEPIIPSTTDTAAPKRQTATEKPGPKPKEPTPRGDVVITSPSSSGNGAYYQSSSCSEHMVLRPHLPRRSAPVLPARRNCGAFRRCIGVILATIATLLRCFRILPLIVCFIWHSGTLLATNALYRIPLYVLLLGYRLVIFFLRYVPLVVLGLFIWVAPSSQMSEPERLWLTDYT